MKNITILIGIIFSMIIFGCKEAKNNLAENEFVLSGELEGIENGSWIYLMLDNKPMDSTKIENNKFSINGITEHPKEYDLFIKNSQNYSSIWIEPGNIHFKAKNGEFKDAIVSGSLSHKQNERLWEPIWEYRKRRDSIRKILNNTELNDSLKFDAKLEQKKIEQDWLKAEKNFIKNNPKSYVSAATLDFYSKTFSKKTVSEFYNNFNEDIKNSSYGKSISRFLEINKNPQIGEKYVDFEMVDTNGAKRRLSQYNGKLVLLEFWASNCMPCRKENPNLIKTYNLFKNKGFEIFAVSIDTEKEDWLRAIEKDKLPWTQVSDLKGEKNEASLIYGINGIPDNFLIAENGKIIGRNLRGEKLNQRLKERLK